ncbi:hypothetical protein FRC06_000351, partial [Ceratobasidium sp. 370]
MRTRDVLALHIREQNAAVLVRKNAVDTTFEIFEVQAPNAAVMSVPGKLIRHFPGQAVQIPDSVFSDQGFIQETANFLVQMSEDILEGSSAKTTKAGSTVSEVRDSADPHYISQLFVAILRGVGKEFEPKRVVKRIADEVLWHDAYLPWHRSPLWLIIRVALQTSLSSTEAYKRFMVFFHAHILDLCHNNPSFSSDLLFVMCAKLARRLLKAQDSAPEFLVRVVGDITNRTEEILQSRWTEIQNRVAKVPSLHLDPQDVIIQPVPNTRQHLQRILEARPNLTQPPPFVPDKISRLLHHADFADFHNGALQKAFAVDKHIALFDFESTVFKNLSGWIDDSLESEFACTKLANKMRVDVHEWPLPAKELDAKAVVFELGCPDALNYWRSATYYILCDLGRSSREQATMQCTLAGYEGLAPWSGQLKRPTHRITLASTTKPFIRSHYKKPKIPASESSVCVKNGLTFKLFDLTQKAWAAGPFFETSFAYFGTFVLPDGSPYQHLRYALEGTSHTSNQVLADQSDCPQDISLHEHYAFGTLRSGSRLQWMNIVRGLEENCLSFNRIEVDLLHTQAAWQIGPLLPDSQFRDWHLELEDPRYGRLLVAQALRMLDRVKGSWLEATSVRTIVMLVTRLLASTTDPSTQQDAYQFLREAQRVTFKWLRELSAKLQTVELSSQVSDYQQRICEMAAICRSTYDVDAIHIPQLFTATRDYQVIVFCSVILHDNRPFDLDKLPSSLQTLICRDRRFAHKIAPTIAGVLTHMPRLLDKAVSQYWNSYRPSSSGWTVHLGSNLRWVSTATESTAERSSQHVHLNLLEGRLLVDGKPLGRLPKEYVAHPAYVRLFGQKVLDVAPSNSPGMEFTARSLIEGNEVSFSMKGSGGELIVRARTEDATFELVAPTYLAEDFPLFFLSDYHHWINLETGVVEFRPLGSPWTSRNENWCLRPASESTYTMERYAENQTAFLMGGHSLTFQSILGQLCPLEDARYIHATFFPPPSRRFLVELPRMKLTFFVNENEQLESDNFRGLVVDESQSTGTMFGLRNQLVLRAKDPVAQSLPRSRCLLIPYGDVSFATFAGHIHANIDLGSNRHIVFYQYKIDGDLGCLTGGVGLTGRLFKIYLHAVTSSCLPDPLTGRTGTEEALHELSESITSSFDEVDSEQARLLQLIGELTPKRKYYPVHLRSMMTTHWHDISPLAQHFAFGTATNSILSRACSLRLFNSSSFDPEPYIANLDTVLLERVAYRTRVYYPLDTAIRLPTVIHGLDNKNQ